MPQDRLIKLIGLEWEVGVVARELYAFASEVNAPAVGALLATCADESERECVDAFRNEFSNHLLPDLKFGARSHFSLANLGGRYEAGAISIADQHFSTEAAERRFKLMVVKINSHTSVERTAGGLRFGAMARYGTESVYCGALHAVLEGSDAAFARDLQETLTADGIDRLAMLRDERQVPADLRSLFAAVVNARLQARRAVAELVERPPATRSLYAILPCVTLDRSLKDTEFVCGLYLGDWRPEVPELTYRGLGDDPSAYRLTEKSGRQTLEDPGIGRTLVRQGDALP